jgi:internalin A
MLGLTSLSVPFTGITDLTGIQYATNLDKLWLTGNNFADLGPLAALSNLTFLTIDFNPLATNLAPLSGLTRLRVLVASENGISDITPLSGLTGLQALSLEVNLITDIGPLKDLPELQMLFLMQNRISDLPVFSAPALTSLNLRDNDIEDISSLVTSNLPSLFTLDIPHNPLGQDAYDIYIPQLLASHPELHIAYDPAPEPGTCTLLGLGGLVLTIARRRGLVPRHVATPSTKYPHLGKECQ